MTTIAYKNGIIATDSQLSCGDVILFCDDEKRREHNGVVFYLSGSIPSMGEFMAAWPDGAIGESCDQAGFVVKDGDVYTACCDDGKVATWLHRKDVAWAYGSGSYFAIGAMDAGLSAADAVAIAIGRDTHSGGKVREYTV